MLAYSIVVVLSAAVLRRGMPDAWRVPVAVSPLVPAILAFWAFVRFYRELDELHRRIQAEALTFSFLLTGFGTFAYGFAERAGLPHVSLVIVLPLMILLWGIGLGLAHRRYA